MTSLHTCYIIHWFVMCPPHTKLTCKIVSVFVVCSYCVCVYVCVCVAVCGWLCVAVAVQVLCGDEMAFNRMADSRCVD